MPDVVNLPNITSQLGTALGIGTFGGQVLMGFIFMALFMMPTLFFCSKYNQDAMWPSLIVGLSSLSAAIVMFSFPSWIVLVMFLLVAFLGAGKVRDWVSGRGSG